MDLSPFRTPLIGRERELAQLHAMLIEPEHRLLTLVGPNGIGKTRLAIEAPSSSGPPLPTALPWWL